MSRERGSVTVLTIGFLVLLGLVVVLVVNASDAFLERQELNNLADGAVLAAADGLDEAGFYTDREVTLDAAESRDLVAAYLAGRGARVVSLRVDDDTVSIVLERDLDLVMAPPGWGSSTTISAEATSQLREASTDGETVP